jgi:hypothetical protein
MFLRSVAASEPGRRKRESMMKRASGYKPFQSLLGFGWFPSADRLTSYWACAKKAVRLEVQCSVIVPIAA